MFRTSPPHTTTCRPRTRPSIRRVSALRIHPTPALDTTGGVLPTEHLTGHLHCREGSRHCQVVTLAPAKAGSGSEHAPGAAGPATAGRWEPRHAPPRHDPPGADDPLLGRLPDLVRARGLRRPALRL